MSDYQLPDAVSKLSTEDLLQRWSRGEITSLQPVRRDDEEDFTPLIDHPELAGCIPHVRKIRRRLLRSRQQTAMALFLLALFAGTPVCFWFFSSSFGPENWPLTFLWSVFQVLLMQMLLVTDYQQPLTVRTSRALWIAILPVAGIVRGPRQAAAKYGVRSFLPRLLLYAVWLIPYPLLIVIWQLPAYPEIGIVLACQGWTLFFIALGFEIRNCRTGRYRSLKNRLAADPLPETAPPPTPLLRSVRRRHIAAGAVDTAALLSVYAILFLLFWGPDVLLYQWAIDREKLPQPLEFPHGTFPAEGNAETAMALYPAGQFSFFNLSYAEQQSFAELGAGAELSWLRRCAYWRWYRDVFRWNEIPVNVFYRLSLSMRQIPSATEVSTAELRGILEWLRLEEFRLCDDTVKTELLALRPMLEDYLGFLRRYSIWRQAAQALPRLAAEQRHLDADACGQEYILRLNRLGLYDNLFLYRLKNVSESFTAAIAYLRLGRAALTLEIHHREYGSWPDSLPAEFIDPFNGEPLGYARTPEGWQLTCSGRRDRIVLTGL